jgi:hypothetical protein
MPCNVRNRCHSLRYPNVDLKITQVIPSKQATRGPLSVTELGYLSVVAIGPTEGYDRQIGVRSRHADIGFLSVVIRGPTANNDRQFEALSSVPRRFVCTAKYQSFSSHLSTVHARQKAQILLLYADGNPTRDRCACHCVIFIFYANRHFLFECLLESLNHGFAV